MRDAIAWSYDLLTPADQRLFRTSGRLRRRLYASKRPRLWLVLVGIRTSMSSTGSRRWSTRAWCVGARASTDEPRFTMLETIREFGLERLAASGEEQETRRRHAAFFLQLVEQLDAFWAPFRPDAQEILDRLEAEFPNLRATLGWLRETGDVAHLLELAGALFYVWQLRGHIREGREWLEWGLGQASNVPPQARAAAQVALAGILYQQTEFARVLELCDAAIALFTEAGDAMGVVDACGNAIPAAYNSGQLDRATAYLEHALSTLATVGNLPWLARSRQRPRAPARRHRADGWPVRCGGASPLADRRGPACSRPGDWRRVFVRVLAPVCPRVYQHRHGPARPGPRSVPSRACARVAIPGAVVRGGGPDERGPDPHGRGAMARGGAAVWRRRGLLRAVRVCLPDILLAGATRRGAPGTLAAWR